MVLTATLRCFGGFWVLQESKVLKFLGFMWNPLSWVMEAAAIMAIALANGGVSAAFYSFFSPVWLLRNPIGQEKKIGLECSTLFCFSDNNKTK